MLERVVVFASLVLCCVADARGATRFVAEDHIADALASAGVFLDFDVQGNVRSASLNERVGGLLDSDRLVQVLHSFPHLTTIAIDKCRISEVAFQSICRIPSLRTLHVIGCDVPANALTHIAEAKLCELRLFDVTLKANVLAEICRSQRESLKRLTIMNPDLPGSGFESIGSLEKLRRLELLDCNITDDHLKAFVGLSRLRFLSLAYTRIRGVGLKHFTECSELKSFDLSGTPIQDENMQIVFELKGLKRLVLSQTGISDRGIKGIGSLESLERLSMAHTRVTDESAKEIASLPKLERLDIEGNSISDTGARCLVSCKRLKFIDVRRTEITKEGIGDLRKHMFRLKVQYVPGVQD